MADKPDLVVRGLSALATGVAAPLLAGIDFVVNGGEFSEEGSEMAFKAITPGVGDVLDNLLDD